MRAQQKEALFQVKLRTFGTVKEADKYMDELCMLIASTSGPIIISSMVEHGLKVFRSIKNEDK